MVSRLIVVETCMYVHTRWRWRPETGRTSRCSAKETLRRCGTGIGTRRRLAGIVPAGGCGCRRTRVWRTPGRRGWRPRMPTRFALRLRGGSGARRAGDWRPFPARQAASGEELPEVDAWLDGTGLSERYAAALRSEGAAATREARAALQSEVEEAIDREGWLGAASFFLVISRNQSMFNDALSAIPEVTVGEGADGWICIERSSLPGTGRRKWWRGGWRRARAWSPRRG